MKQTCEKGRYLLCVYAYMELAAIVIERPGTELVYVTVVILQDLLFHGPGVTGAGRPDHCKGQRLLISGLLHSAIPPVSLVLMVSSVLVLCCWTALREIPTTAPISPSVSSRTQCSIKMLCPGWGTDLSCIACPVPKAAAFQRMFPSHADASLPGSSQRLHGTVPACKNGQTGSASRNHQG